MATGVNFNITIVTKDLQKNMGQVTKQVKDIEKNITKSFANSGQEVKKLNVNVKELNRSNSNLVTGIRGIQIQFALMAGAAMHSLQQIKQTFQEVITDGAESQDAIVRAFSAINLDITDQGEENIRLLKLYNDAIRDLGSGATIFGPKEVANVFEQVGRALPTLRTKAQEVGATIAVSQEVLKLMTVENVNAKDATIGYAKVLSNFPELINDVTRLTDVLVNTNRQSAAELNELVNSFGFAGQAGKNFGLSIEEIGAMLGLVHNITPQAGRAFTQLMREFATESTVFNKQLVQMGINITDANGNFRNFRDIMKEVAMKTKEIREQFGDRGVVKFQEMFGLDNNAARAFLALIENAERLDDLVADAGKRGTATKTAEFIQFESAQSGIRSLQASLQSLKLDFVVGLLPAIQGLTKEITALVRDKTVQEFFREFGSLLSQEVLPLITLLIKGLKKFTKFMKENAGIAQLLVKGLVALTAVLIGLFIVGTIGLLLSVMAGGILKLIGVAHTLIPILTTVRTLMFTTAIGSFLATAGWYALAAAAGVVIGLGLAEEIQKWTNELDEQAYEGYVNGMNDSTHGFLEQWIELNRQDPNSWIGAVIRGLDDLSLWLGDVKDGYDQLIRDMGARFFTGLGEMSLAFDEFFTTTLPEAIAKAGEVLWDLGVQIVSYLWNGFTSAIGAVGGVLQPIIDNIFASTAGFFEQGALIGYHIWEGIKTAIGSLLDLILGTGGGPEGENTDILTELAEYIKEFLEDPLGKIEEWSKGVEDVTDTTAKLQEQTVENIGSNLINKEQLDQLSDLYKGPLTTANNAMGQGLLDNKNELGFLEKAFEALRQAVAELEAKIRKTNVKFEKNDEGDLVGYKFIGGATKDDINSAISAFTGGGNTTSAVTADMVRQFGTGILHMADGGIVNRPTFAEIGEAGPEAVIPLDQLGSLGGNTNITINVNVEGNASRETAEDIAREVERVIVDKIGNKYKLRVR